MRGRKTKLKVVLSAEQREFLESQLRRHSISLAMARRYRVILAVAEGMSLVATAREVGMTEKHVRKWLKRFLEDGCEGLGDRPGRGRKPSFSPRGGPARRQAGL